MEELVVNNDPFLSLRKKRRSKILIVSLLIVLIGGAGVYGYQKFASQQSAAPSMQFTTVKRGDVTETVSAPGTVQAPKQISLNFSGSGGNVSSVNVKVGDHVKAGQVLATLDDSTAKAQVADAQANVSASQAHLADAQRSATPQDIAVQQANVNKAKVALDGATDTYNYQKKLYDLGDLTKMALDQAQNSMQQAQAAYDSAVAQLNQTLVPPQSSTIQAAQAAVEQAQAQLQQQQIALSKLTLKAPIDGVITQVNGNVGEVPSNNPAFIVMDNSDSVNLQVMAQISQTDIGKVKTDMDATFTTTAYADKQFTGKVTTIYPEATTTSGVTTYNVLLSVDNQEGLLKPGMTTNVVIQVGTHQNVLYIPAAALQDQNGKVGVLVTGNVSSPRSASSAGNNSSTRTKGQNSSQGQANTRFHFQAVATGYLSTDRVEITSGLKEGDQIVLAIRNTSGSTTRGSSGGFGGIPGMGGSFGGSMGGGRGGH